MAKSLTWKTTDSTVRATSGRGRNKVIVLEVSFKELERWAKRQMIDTKTMLNKSFVTATTNVKSKLVKVITRRGGVEGVPKFHDFEEFTKSLRAVRGLSSRPMGGILADKEKFFVSRINGYWRVGWVDRLAEWAVKFQEGGDYKAEANFQSDGFRRWMHVLGIQDIPRTYAHNPRQVLPEPFK